AAPGFGSTARIRPGSRASTGLSTSSVCGRARRRQVALRDRHGSLDAPLRPPDDRLRAGGVGLPARRWARSRFRRRSSQPV
ncbi:MAG: hypothetical protein AVDCRST_MAG02-3743, partial [uncultured Rubrobacteraceae bacterium]